MKFRRSYLLVLLLSISWHLAAQKSTTSAALDSIIKAHLGGSANNAVHSILIYLKQGDNIYHKGFGKADGKSQKVDKDFQFKIASVTKTFTATIILQMEEEGLLKLSDPIAKYLKKVPFVHLDNIHLLGGKSYGRTITIQQLLQHRSGLADPFFDKFQEFMAYWEADPKQTWSPEKLFAYFYKMDLNKSAHFPPGKGYHYSDTNYFLLGLIIEQISGQTLAEQYRKRILKPLEMINTYFEYYEPATGNGKLAHSFFGDRDITVEANTSFDWSGGGLISTSADLARFIEALIQQKLFKKESTLKKMLTTHPTSSSYKYGMGLQELTYHGKKYIGHSGFWGVLMLYCAKNQQTLCLSINQVSPSFGLYQFPNKLIPFLKKND